MAQGTDKVVDMDKKTFECMVLVLLIFCISHLAAEPCGDVNSKDGINIVEALLIAQFYVGLDPADFDDAAADVNADGKINIVDALLIAQYYVGLITELPGCSQTPEPTNPPQFIDCSEALVWSTDEIYDIAGTRVQYNGDLYENNWYSQNQNPEQNSGANEVWTLIGPCDVEITPVPATPTPTPTDPTPTPTSTLTPGPIITPDHNEGLVAFPGAEGYGKVATAGGRGGAVYEVTNLNSSGTGSFGAAIAASGPRTVVFRVSGTINSSFKISVEVAETEIPNAGNTKVYTFQNCQVNGEVMEDGGTTIALTADGSNPRIYALCELSRYYHDTPAYSHSSANTHYYPNTGIKPRLPE